MSVNNVEKILSYLYPLAKHEVVFAGKCYPGIERIILRKSLFYTDECKICGKCCIAEANVFLPFEVDRMDDILSGQEDIDNITHKTNNRGLENIKELRESLTQFTTTVNGVDIKLFQSKLSPNIYEFADRGILKRCHWDLPIEDGRLGCGIHQVSSLTCQMPHIRFLYRKDNKTTHIGTMQYGRNWAMKCPVEFSKEFSIARVQELLWKFKRLNQYSDYFGIESYIPDIVKNIEQVKSLADVQRVCDVNIIDNNSKLRALF